MAVYGHMLQYIAISAIICIYDNIRPKIRILDAWTYIFGCQGLYFGRLDLYLVVWTCIWVSGLVFGCLSLYFGHLDLHFGCLDLGCRMPVYL